MQAKCNKCDVSIRHGLVCCTRGIVQKRYWIQPIWYEWGDITWPQGGMGWEGIYLSLVSGTLPILLVIFCLSVATFHITNFLMSKARHACALHIGKWEEGIFGLTGAGCPALLPFFWSK